MGILHFKIQTRLADKISISVNAEEKRDFSQGVSRIFNHIAFMTDEPSDFKLHISAGGLCHRSNCYEMNGNANR